jgi:hypothetical protein
MVSLDELIFRRISSPKNMHLLTRLFITDVNRFHVLSFFIITDWEKLFNRPKTLDFFNPPAGGYF